MILYMKDKKESNLSIMSTASQAEARVGQRTKARRERGLGLVGHIFSDWKDLAERETEIFMTG